MYKKGIDNTAADALSRRLHDQATLCAMSAAVPHWLTEVVDGYKLDDHSKELIAKLTISPQAVPHFTFHDGVLRYKNRIWLGNNKSLQLKVLAALHCSPLGGHSGIPVTYSKLKQYFAWIGIKKDVHDFVKSCTICQQAKPDRSKYSCVAAVACT